VRARAKASTAGSTSAGGSSPRSSRQTAKLIAALVLAIAGLAVVPAPASALTVTINPATNVSYASADVSGESPLPWIGENLLFEFEYSTDHVNWTIANPIVPENLWNASTPQPFKTTIRGLNGGTKYFVRVSVSSYVCGLCDTVVSPEIELETLPVAKPAVLTVAGATTVFSTTAHVSGEVERPSNPDPAFDAHCRFEYVDDAQFAVTGFESAQATPCEPNLVTTPGAHPVTADLNGLAPGTTYHLRLAAENAGGVDSEEAPTTFTTDPAVTEPPTIVGLGAATGIGYATASIGGEVERPTGPDPALNLDCHFEYVSDADFQAQNEQQALFVAATGGTFTLSFEGQTTSPIAFDASAAVVQAALDSLSTVDPGAITVSGGPGDESGSTPYFFAFAGALAAKDIEPLISDPTALEGPAVAEVQTTREGRPEGFNNPGRVGCTPNPVVTAGVTQVSANLHGLQFGTLYHLRLTVSNFAGAVSQLAPNFTTLAAPKAQTLDAGAVGPDSATLAARINPLEAPVTYQFEWGPTASYGEFAPTTPEQLASGDDAFHSVTARIDGLREGTTYHYRIVATNTDTGEVTSGEDRTFVTTSAAVSPPGGCPNGPSRVGLSAELPDCRAYEWVTPDINGVFSENGFGVPRVLADGSAIAYITQDVPDNAEGGFVSDWTVSRKGPDGWSTESLGPPAKEPIEAYLAASNNGSISPDLTEVILFSARSLAPGMSSGETNFYVRHADGTFSPLTNQGDPVVPGGGQFLTTANTVQASADYKHFFIQSVLLPRQLPTDPTGDHSGNTYERSGGELRLVGIEPGGQTPFPFPVAVQGGALPGISADGGEVLFSQITPGEVKGSGLGPLYLREYHQRTVEVSKSQRSTVDPNPAAVPRSVGVTSDGSEVLFTSASELTDDANTGEAGGSPSDLGADLYSYDVASETLTDLTADDSPADRAQGANVTRVLAATPDASYIYFVATGDLAAGGVSGDPNLYVEHGGVITFVAPAEGLNQLSISSDGRFAAIGSTESLTGYDNVNPETGNAMEMAFLYSYGGEFQCVSCRPDGEPPTARAVFLGRSITDDGGRMFFQSADAVLPQADNGLAHVYEYSGGSVHLLSPAASKVPAVLMGASATGDDVFISTYEEIVPGAGRSFAVYDARVNADTFKAAPPQCQAESCRGEGTSPPRASKPGTNGVETHGEVNAPRSKAAEAKRLKLRITVPESGRLTVSGKGVKTVKKSVAAAGSVTLTVTLTPAADKKRMKHGSFKTKVTVLFKPGPGSGAPATESRSVVALRFQRPNKKGGK
jgi:hypothetical protein